LHARIEQAEHRFSFDCFDPQVFSATTVTELVEHYKEPSRCVLFANYYTVFRRVFLCEDFLRSIFDVFFGLLFSHNMCVRVIFFGQKAIFS
jgi:hypothetical protein